MKNFNISKYIFINLFAFIFFSNCNTINNKQFKIENDRYILSNFEKERLQNLKSKIKRKYWFFGSHYIDIKDITEEELTNEILKNNLSNLKIKINENSYKLLSKNELLKYNLEKKETPWYNFIEDYNYYLNLTKKTIEDFGISSLEDNDLIEILIYTRYI